MKVPMYVCICARVRDCELRTAIRAGARTEEAVGEACGAGTGCGSCLDRLDDLIMEEGALVRVAAPSTLAPDTLVAATA